MRACGRRSSSSTCTTSSGMYGGRIVRDKLWFYTVFRQVGRGADRAGHVREQERRQPEFLDRGLRQIQAGVQQQPGAPGDDPADVAGDAAQQVQLPLVRAVQRRELRSGWRRRRAADDAGSVEPGALRPVPSTPRELAVADLGPAAGRGRLGRVSGPVPLRAAQRRHVHPTDDPALGAGRRARLHRERRLHPGPAFADAPRPGAGRLHALADRERLPPCTPRCRMSPARTT